MNELINKIQIKEVGNFKVKTSTNNIIDNNMNSNKGGEVGSILRDSNVNNITEEEINIGDEDEKSEKEGEGEGEGGNEEEVDGNTQISYCVNDFQGELDPVLSLICYGDFFIYGSLEGSIRKIQFREGLRTVLYQGHRSWVTKLIKFNDVEEVRREEGENRDNNDSNDEEEGEESLEEEELKKVSFISCSKDKDIRFWNFEGEGSLWRLSGHTGGVCDIAVNSEKTLLCSCGDEGLVLLWDLVERRILKSYSGHLAKVTGCGFYGKFLISCSWDGFLKIVDTQTDQMFKIYNTNDNIPISCFTNIQNYFFLGCLNGDLLICDILKEKTDMYDHFERLEHNICSLAVLDDYLFIAGENKKLLQYDISKILGIIKSRMNKGKRRRRRRKKEEESESQKKEEKEEKKLLIQLIHTYEGHENSISTISLIEKEKRLFTGAHDKTVKEWDVKLVHQKILKEKEVEKEVLKQKLLDKGRKEEGGNSTSRRRRGRRGRRRGRRRRRRRGGS